MNSCMSSKFESSFNGTYRWTRQTESLEPQRESEFKNQAEVDSYVNDEVEMLTDINSTKRFRLGSVMMVKDLEVNDINFLSLTMGKQTSEDATGVLKKIKNGYTTSLGVKTCQNAEGNNVTTFSTNYQSVSKSTRPLPTLREWLSQPS